MLEPGSSLRNAKCPECCPFCRHGACIDPDVCPGIASSNLPKRKCPDCCPRCRHGDCSNPEVCPNSQDLINNQTNKGNIFIQYPTIIEYELPTFSILIGLSNRCYFSF